MPTVAYEVIVGVSAEVADCEEVAIAEASRYLAYADHTDTFGYHGRVFGVDTYDGSDGGWSEDVELDWGVCLHFTAPIGLLPDKAKFERELDKLAHVESWQEVPYKPIDKSEV